MFLETPRFPGCVSFGAVSGPRYSTVRTVVASGHDDVLIRYEQAVHKYTFEHANRTQFEHDELLKFFHAVKGMGHRFRVKDYSDYQVTIANGVLSSLHAGLTVGASGTGYGTRTHVLQKAYTAGALTTYRDINKPIATVPIYRGGILQTLTTNYTIDYTTGVVTFVEDQTRGVASHTIGASHIFTLSSAFSPNVTIGQRVYVTDVTGTAATTLNNLSHQVTGISGATVTIATNTTGLTAASGNLYIYPQATEALAWAGEFDVPCRFLDDEASWQIVDKSGDELLYSWAGIDLTEVRIAL